MGRSATFGDSIRRCPYSRDLSVSFARCAFYFNGFRNAEAASAGNSTGPHLHFEVWGTGFYELADPWAGPCGPNYGPSLWAHEPPWANRE
ncbi:MAG TPA: hypothetical protein VER96_21905 [Polyangiaceae bacterium]|nr:hypothetical protein [Polyangiaceae bacterium]